MLTTNEHNADIIPKERDKKRGVLAMLLALFNHHWPPPSQWCLIDETCDCPLPATHQWLSQKRDTPQPSEWMYVHRGKTLAMAEYTRAK